jgi:hypothetical protein
MTTAKSDQAEPPQPPMRLMLDTQSERIHAHLRVAAALVALSAGAWLAWVEGRLWLRLTALASVAFALRWLTVQRAVRATLANPEAHYLEIIPGQVVIATGASQRTVSSESVQAVELDDDRLVVVLRLRSGEAVTIEPRYGDLDLRELGQALHRALCAPTHRDAPG